MSSSSSIGDEILQKQMDCVRQDYKLEAVFIHPMDAISLILDSRYQDGTYYAQNSAPLEKGEIGRFLGIKIIVTNNVPIHKLLFSVNMGGYRSVQGPAWDKEKIDERVNPSRRDN
jgi:hypothetical protein